MNREDIIRMAREADREWDCDRDMFEWLEWFANLVAAAEREACAKLADSERHCTEILTSNPPQSAAARNIANDIRARGN